MEDGEIARLLTLYHIKIVSNKNKKNLQNKFKKKKKTFRSLNWVKRNLSNKVYQIDNSLNHVSYMHLKKKKRDMIG
jgi:hypothetical protein